MRGQEKISGPTASRLQRWRTFLVIRRRRADRTNTNLSARREPGHLFILYPDGRCMISKTVPSDEDQNLLDFLGGSGVQRLMYKVMIVFEPGRE